MIIKMLNYLHRKGYTRVLNAMSVAAYLLKGNGLVKSAYHRSFRGYEYKVGGIVYLSMGPGWAYNFNYLSEVLKQTFCYQYMPQPGDCVIDIGAGLGEETVIFALRVSQQGKVHAIEANPVTFKGLKYLCEQNNFTQATAHNLAVYKTDGEVAIEDNEENYLTNTIQTTTGSKGFMIKAVSLDTFVRENKIARIDFLKCNIEGAEQFLIEGMDHSVSIIRNVCISCHDFRHKFYQHGTFYMTKEKMITFFARHGFEITTRNTGNMVTDDYIYARNLKIN